MSDAGIQIATFVDPFFGENAYVVNTPGGACWVIDPGLPPSAESILEHIRAHTLRPDAIVLTHAHADHIAGIPEILTAYPNLPVYLADGEAGLLTDAEHNLSAGLGFGITVAAPDRRDLAAGSTMELDGTTWRIIDVSGHSPAGRALYCPEAGVVIVGDALFAGGIGRTDFPHSREERLIQNIHEGLFTLPDDTRVLSGHGPGTTIGVERRTNPFVGVAVSGRYAH